MLPTTSMNETAGNVNPAGYQPLQLRNTIGDLLWSKGYRAFVRDACTLWIRKPNGDRYILHAFNQTCSCIAGQRGISCKHVKSATELVFLSADELLAKGKRNAGKALYEFWGLYTEALYAQQRGGK